ncbi:MAG: protein-disulfide isomerase [SAR86 cluster bacterium]|uniref:Thiol:disulfide interchange protein n=1 Tax=SAR86 cluster bacterium TaxID=2030880 RepID=A0A2A4MJG4_9GAMM|nr:MAG: protein-disulfide isomerase [SAR86 cluster bacterium]
MHKIISRLILKLNIKQGLKLAVKLTPKLLMALLILPSVLHAQGLSDNDIAMLRAKLSPSLEVASGNQLQIVNIKATELASVVEVELNTGEVLYSDISGSFLFSGDMFRVTDNGLSNLSGIRRQGQTLDKIAAIDESEMIIYTPELVKASITVFTDVDCTYCRALHRDLDELMANGIEVRYLAYPRGGESAGSYQKMISVWCSDDRHKSLTQAKNGQNLPERDCQTPILEHYGLGNELGISGTPALILPSGQLIPGYMDAEKLIAMLLPENAP